MKRNEAQNTKTKIKGFKMATATMNYDAMVKGITSETTDNSLAAAIANMNVTPIDAKLAYSQANNGKLGNEAKALASICRHIAGIYEASGKAAGVSTIYNVIDARIVRKVRFTKKLAFNLQGSKALAQFIALTTPMLRNEHTRKAISVNGNVFTQNRNGYHTETINAKGKAVKVRKPQAANEAKAIASGLASSITSAPHTQKGKRIAKIAGQLIAGIVGKPLAIEASN